MDIGPKDLVPLALSLGLLAYRYMLCLHIRYLLIGPELLTHIHTPSVCSWVYMGFPTAQKKHDSGQESLLSSKEIQINPIIADK